ncbi:MAG TPA: tRNA preQ1(34) S-adenosylmethionine ribosyltransferase-isomerase QueA [Thermomicrobiales bacterium]|nr:tRNA preQ1(34) S-adenosylmethionine ribosyltransferase-isomerase QueA [Thermomicrobiales bacterium]
MAGARRTGMQAFDYDLPPDLIAQEPLADRSGSRLLLLPRDEGAPEHHRFNELPDLLDPGDLLVVNDTRVQPARLSGNRHSGAEVEILLLRDLGAATWRTLIRPWRRLREGERVVIRSRSGKLESGATIVEKLPEGEAVVRLDPAVHQSLEAYGRVPLPPYIDRQLEDDDRYQTVYAERTGSAAAPTAGLHFTPEVFDRLAGRNIAIASVTLHVGLDTFRPVTSEFAEDHRIHSEWCHVPEATVGAIGDTRTCGGKVIAVGTTTARTLESFGRDWDGSRIQAFEGMTDIFITPGFEWKITDGLITNFHLPRSTLLLMVSSLVGRERMLDAYQEAIRQRYRFFSFGDAMLILGRTATTSGTPR